VTLYRVSAEGYLARAQTQLALGSSEALFYAAFELRACIEARQDQYLDAQRAYARGIPRSWKIGNQRRELSRIFEGQKIQLIRIRLSSGLETFRYIPVVPGLSKAAEQLGDVLHAQEKFREKDDPWWLTLREWISRIAVHAEYCCAGELLCPCLVRAGMGSLAVDLKNNLMSVLPEIRPGKTFEIQVDYKDDWLDELPSLDR